MEAIKLVVYIMAWVPYQISHMDWAIGEQGYEWRRATEIPVTHVIAHSSFKRSEYDR